jgi:hypothetical protein
MFACVVGLIGFFRLVVQLVELCPFIAAAVEIHDPSHPARVYAREYKKALAARLTETAREAGATNPEELGEQLAMLLDGASARSRVLNTSTFSTAAAIAAVLIDNAIPTAAVPPGADRHLSAGTGPCAGCGGDLIRG